MPSWPDRIGPTISDLVGAYKAYLRVLHPARRQGRPASWTELARGRPVEAASRLDALVAADPLRTVDRFRPPDWGEWPQDTLDAAQLRVLLEHAVDPADAGRLWAMFWMGIPGVGDLTRYGHAREVAPPGGRENPGFPTPFLAVHLDVSVLLDLAEQGVHRPYFLWPEGERWTLASEIDTWSSYFGGDPDLVQRLALDARIEAMEVDPDVGRE